MYVVMLLMHLLKTSLCTIFHKDYNQDFRNTIITVDNICSDCPAKFNQIKQINFFFNASTINLT